MRASLNGLEVDVMEWNTIYDNKKVDTKTKKQRPLVPLILRLIGGIG
jgi:hypothetical protein